KYDRRKRSPSEAGCAFNPSLTTSNAPVKLEPSASFIAGSTKCLVSSGVHFSGTLKAPAVVTKDEQALGRAERKNVFRAHQTTPRVLWSAWTLDEESVKTPETDANPTIFEVSLRCS